MNCDKKSRSAHLVLIKITNTLSFTHTTFIWLPKNSVLNDFPSTRHDTILAWSWSRIEDVFDGFVPLISYASDVPTTLLVERAIFVCDFGFFVFCVSVWVRKWVEEVLRARGHHQHQVLKKLTTVRFYSTHPTHVFQLFLSFYVVVIDDDVVSAVLVVKKKVKNQLIWSKKWSLVKKVHKKYSKNKKVKAEREIVIRMTT